LLLLSSLGFSQQSTLGYYRFPAIAGDTLFFTRLPFQGSYTKRYRGGTAQNLWKFTGAGEATVLTSDYTGTSKNPMVWQHRVYFLSDRDGTMNLWSIDENGHDPRQHTRHAGFDVLSPSLSGGRIVYQLVARQQVVGILGAGHKPDDSDLPLQH
jgi:tricorn protease